MRSRYIHHCAAIAIAINHVRSVFGGTWTYANARADCSISPLLVSASLHQLAQMTAQLHAASERLGSRNAGWLALLRTWVLQAKARQGKRLEVGDDEAAAEGQASQAMEVRVPCGGHTIHAAAALTVSTATFDSAAMPFGPLPNLLTLVSLSGCEQVQVEGILQSLEAAQAVLPDMPVCLPLWLAFASEYCRLQVWALLEVAAPSRASGPTARPCPSMGLPLMLALDLSCNMSPALM